MKKIVLFLVFCSLSMLSHGNEKVDDEQVIQFTSAPDIFNWNISNPQQGWDEALDWFFSLLYSDGPDFNLNAGDIMDARWWESDTLIRQKTQEYWTGFLKRYEDVGLTVYVAPGDHEYGDDGGLARAKVARVFAQQFTDIMKMPKNGPKNHMGRAFFVRKKNLLIISLDTFEDLGGRKFDYSVGTEQLNWMEETLLAHSDAEFVIVQGHLPIVGPVNSKDTSASMLKGGVKSNLWKLMVKYDVDVYLAGEHHRITTKKIDGIWQIVHGALWGQQEDLNYLRGVVKPGEMKLQLMEFEVEYSGERMGSLNHPHRKTTSTPWQNVSISQNTIDVGPRVTGTLIIESKSGVSKETETTGWFDKSWFDTAKDYLGTKFN